MNKHLRTIAEAYNQSLPFYNLFWGTYQNMGINYGYWTSTTKNLSEAIQSLNQFIFEKLSLEAGEILLDAGCGVGGTLIAAAKKYKTKGIGLNISSKQLAQCEKNASKHQVQSVLQFINATYESIPIEVGTVDKVVAIESLFHASNKSLFLSEAHRVLKSGGKLIVADYFLSKSDYKESEQQVLNRWWKGYQSAPLLTIEVFVEILEKQGFSLVSYENISTNVLPSSKRIHDYGKKGSQVYQFLSKLRLDRLFGLNTTQLDATQAQYQGLQKGLWEYGVFELMSIGQLTYGHKLV